MGGGVVGWGDGGWWGVGGGGWGVGGSSMFSYLVMTLRIICTVLRFIVFCCGLVPADFTYSLQGYFADTGAIVRCQWTIPKKAWANQSQAFRKKIPYNHQQCTAKHCAHLREFIRYQTENMDKLTTLLSFALQYVVKMATHKLWKCLNCMH